MAQEFGWQRLLQHDPYVVMRRRLLGSEESGSKVRPIERRSCRTVVASSAVAMFAPMPRKLLTDRLYLRPWRPSDATPHRQLWAERDPRSLRVIDADGRPTPEDLRKRMADEFTAARSGLGLYAVERRDGGDFIGYCGLTLGQATAEEPEIAYELARRVHGNGYATEAAAIVVAEAAATGRRRLWATVREWNTASFRVLEKLGFSDSGRVTTDPDRGDTIWMTIDLAVR